MIAIEVAAPAKAGRLPSQMCRRSMAQVMCYLAVIMLLTNTLAIVKTETLGARRQTGCTVAFLQECRQEAFATTSVSAVVSNDPAITTPSLRKGRQSSSRPLKQLLMARWTADEDTKLRDAVARTGLLPDCFDGHDGRPSIAELVPGRTATACVERWNNQLAPGLVTGPSTVLEDTTTMLVIPRLDIGVAELARMLRRGPTTFSKRWLKIKRDAAELQLTFAPRKAVSAGDVARVLQALHGDDAASYNADAVADALEIVADDAPLIHGQALLNARELAEEVGDALAALPRAAAAPKKPKKPRTAFEMDQRFQYASNASKAEVDVTERLAEICAKYACGALSLRATSRCARQAVTDMCLARAQYVNPVRTRLLKFRTWKPFRCDEGNEMNDRDEDEPHAWSVPWPEFPNAWAELYGDFEYLPTRGVTGETGLNHKVAYARKRGPICRDDWDCDAKNVRAFGRLLDAQLLAELGPRHGLDFRYCMGHHYLPGYFLERDKTHTDPEKGPQNSLRFLAGLDPVAGAASKGLAMRCFKIEGDPEGITGRGNAARVFEIPKGEVAFWDNNVMTGLREPDGALRRAAGLLGAGRACLGHCCASAAMLAPLGVTTTDHSIVGDVWALDGAPFYDVARRFALAVAEARARRAYVDAFLGGGSVFNRVARRKLATLFVPIVRDRVGGAGRARRASAPRARPSRDVVPPDFLAAPVDTKRLARECRPHALMACLRERQLDTAWDRSAVLAQRIADAIAVGAASAPGAPAPMDVDEASPSDARRTEALSPGILAAFAAKLSI